jgi:hypothetical protein
MTWNFRAARSVDGGVTFHDINPYADFPDFCCDQDALYDRGRDMIVWSRVGVPDINGNNRLKISRANNDGVTWCTYTITGGTIGAAGKWFDYPKIAMSNNYLYITTNMFTAAGLFQQMVLMRWSLDSLKTCSVVNFWHWTRTVGWSWEPAQGARQVMYLGDTTNSAGTFTVFTQPESSSALFFVDKAIPSWTFTNHNAHCPVLGGHNPCLRADQRITAAVVANNTSGGSLENGVITFFWNVKEEAGFPFPYVEAASFSESTLAYIRRPFIWNRGHAWFWAAASTNGRGDIGLTVYFFSRSSNPAVFAGIDDDYNGDPPGWELKFINGSTGQLTEDAWGDYSTVRPHFPGAMAWGAAVYTLDAFAVPQPQFVIFGRQRDQSSINRWWNR